MPVPRLLTQRLLFKIHYRKQERVELWKGVTS